MGDIISPTIVYFTAKKNGIDIHKHIPLTKHLYAVGSVLTTGCQDCTVWGSGILYSHIYWLKHRKIHVRAVRVPITRMVLMEHGRSVPEVYGDPAVLIPLMYNPEVEKMHRVSVITHMNEPAFIPEN